MALRLDEQTGGVFRHRERRTCLTWAPPHKMNCTATKLNRVTSRRPSLAYVAIGVVHLTAGFAAAQTLYEAQLDASQVVFNPSSTTATGVAFFSLNEEGTHLSYSLSFDGLDLEPIVANRIDPNDIVGIHMHLTVTDVIGPHILNIFGTPSEDDADLAVDYENESLSGVYDMSDASRDPKTGELLPQFFPLTTKLISDWLDELAASELYIAVHTVEASATPPGVAIRGQIIPTVPEPHLVVWLWWAGGLLLRKRGSHE